MEKKVIKMKLCLGSSCFSRGNESVLEIMKEYIENNGLADKIDFRGHLCKGSCNTGPNLSIGDEEFKQVSESNILLILKEALKPLTEKAEA